MESNYLELMYPELKPVTNFKLYLVYYRHYKSVQKSTYLFSNLSKHIEWFFFLQTFILYLLTCQNVHFCTLWIIQSLSFIPKFVYLHLFQRECYFHSDIRWMYSFEFESISFWILFVLVAELVVAHLHAISFFLQIILF